MSGEQCAVQRALVQVGDELVWLDRPVCAQTAAALATGCGLFETIRVVGGSPLRFGEHIDRLRKSARALGWAQAIPRSPRRSLEPLFERTTGRDGVLKLIVAAPSQRAPERPTWIALFEVLRPQPEHIELTAIEHPLAPPNPLAAHKTLSRLPLELAHERALAAGKDDALLLDRSGRVLETTRHNVFWVDDGVLHTPALELGLLPGVIRAEVIGSARRLGIPCRLVEAPLEALLAADEAFVTNALCGALPIRALDEHTFEAAPGPLTRRIQQALAEYERWSLERVRGGA